MSLLVRHRVVRTRLSYVLEKIIYSQKFEVASSSVSVVADHSLLNSSLALPEKGDACSGGSVG